MRKFYIFIILLFHFVLFAEGQVVWERTFQHSPLSLGATGAIQCDDGNFIVIGNASSDVFMAKVNPAGDSIWSKLFSMNTTTEALDVKQTPDSGYIITGRVYENGSNDLFLLKTDGSGNAIWSKYYGGPLDDVGNSICVLQGGGFIVAGFTNSYGAGGGYSSLYLLRTDQNGDTLSTAVFWESGKSDVGKSISPTSDGGFIIAGSGGRGAALIRIDANGDTLWSNSFGASNFSSGSQAIQSIDGGFLMTGTVDCGGSGPDFDIIKTDSLGLILWSKAYGGASLDRSMRISQQADSTILIGGNYGYFSTADSLWELFIKTNNTGDTIWTRCYNPFQYCTVGSLLQTADSGYIFAGTGYDSGNSTLLYLVKANEDGNANCNSSHIPVTTCTPSLPQSRINLIVSSTNSSVTNLSVITGGSYTDSVLCATVFMPEIDESKIKIYPNPAENQFSISTFSTGTISVFNLLGEEVVRKKSILKSGSQITIDISGLRKGIYFVHLQTENGTVVQKLMKQ